jgi:hypothetical protein
LLFLRSLSLSFSFSPALSCSNINSALLHFAQQVPAPPHMQDGTVLSRFPLLMCAVCFSCVTPQASATCTMTGWAGSESAAVSGAETSTTGTITDGSGNYPSSQVCYKAITISNAASVQISFSSFNTESDYDQLYIYDGTSTSSTVKLNGWSGSRMP